MEEAELVSDDPTTQQLLATLALADHSLDNEGGLDALTADLQALLRELAAALTP
jgi:hypothetical protein